jgi:hypothetical protein
MLFIFRTPVVANVEYQCNEALPNGEESDYRTRAR